MLKRLTRLGVVLAAAAVALVGAPAQAQSDRPTSMDRHLAPDRFPTNVVKILRTSNKAQTNSYVPVVFSFVNNNPFNVIRMLHKPVQEEEGVLFTFVNPEGSGGRVLFMVPEYMIPSLESLVRSVDIAGLTSSANDLRIYRQLKHRRADLSDPGFIETAASFSTANGSNFITDPANNALYYEDAPSGAQALDGALTSLLDVPTAMVQLVVKIYELDSYNDGKIGLDYQAWKNTLGQNLFVVGAFDEYGSISRTGTTTFPPLGTGAIDVPKNNFSAQGYNYAYRYEVNSSFFDFLQTKGKARLLNQAKLAALNSRTAILSAGDQVLYYAIRTTNPSGIRDTDQPFQANGGRTVTGTTLDSDLTPVETGLDLVVTPTIGTESILMDIDLTWSNYTGFGGDGFPIINSRSLSTEMRMAVGEEVIIGGLTRQTRVKGTSKVPFLGSLPIIGYAFGGETGQNRNTEMVVAIQPIGIMDYKIAYNVSADDQAIIDKASDENVEVELPSTTWGFDMMGIDHGKLTTDQVAVDGE